jgi:hypothetical protein
LAGGQSELRLLVIGVGADAERQGRSDGDFGALAIRCEMLRAHFCGTVP